MRRAPLARFNAVTEQGKRKAQLDEVSCAFRFAKIVLPNIEYSMRYFLRKIPLFSTLILRGFFSTGVLRKISAP